MIQKENGELVAECTECGIERAGGVEESLARFVDALKADGWRIVKDHHDDVWMHFCPDCEP